MNRIMYCMFKEKICPIVDSLAVPVPSQARLHGAAPSVGIMHLLCVAYKEQEKDSIRLHWVQPDQVEIIGNFKNNMLELKKPISLFEYLQPSKKRKEIKKNEVYLS